MPSSQRMPVVFIGHGSPINTLEDNRFTGAWRALAAALPRPDAILVISAHWFMAATAVTAMARPRTIHDLFGFGRGLSEFQYPAPGHPELARQVVSAVRPRWVGLDEDSWGLDHGTWSVLAQMYPRADIPVVQLSLNATKELAYHQEVGARLAPLRDQGVLILGSGNVVHNLRRFDPRRGETGLDWAVRFDEAARALMTTAPGRIAELRSHPDWEEAVPITDHFLPLVYIAALAEQAAEPASVLVDGYAGGSLSMTCYLSGMACPPVPDGKGAALLPESAVPADQTNL